MSYRTTTTYRTVVPSTTTTYRTVVPATTTYYSSRSIHPTTTTYHGTTSYRSIGYSFRSFEPKQDDPALAWFDAVDQDRSGSIDAKELSKALSKGGYEDFSLGMAERMISMFDKDGGGKIERTEFQQLMAFVESMRAAFREKDTDGSGTLESDEVRRALADSGYELRDSSFRGLMRKYDPERNGGLKLDDYISMTLLLGTASKEFQSHEACLEPVQGEGEGEGASRAIIGGEEEDKPEKPEEVEAQPATAMWTFDDFIDTATKF